MAVEYIGMSEYFEEYVDSHVAISRLSSRVGRAHLRSSFIVLRASLSFCKPLLEFRRTSIAVRFIEIQRTFSTDRLRTNISCMVVSKEGIQYYSILAGAFSLVCSRNCFPGGHFTYLIIDTTLNTPPPSSQNDTTLILVLPGAGHFSFNPLSLIRER